MAETVPTKRYEKIEEKENEDVKEIVAKRLKTESPILRTPPRPSKTKALSWEEIQARLRSPSFTNKVKETTTKMLNPVIDPKARDRDNRCRMHAKDDCSCCRPYFDSLGLSEKETLKRIQQVGKHRAVFHYPKTPPRYWDLELRERSPKKSPINPGAEKRRK
ncbi:unnamed protein product [Bursaphelenchus xylophilus]|uniref:(pine wood nematode) hypothetical protein n=1 Tax=Bursaphelenchus xylophilus TaxID=6326 RepID=A0A1I7RRA5_BURXY|nr:unnamed protein product [Bursaphelenchus xylophilus]CAG9130898.1 unnamed protein product [Bursaphelenchus xylophilus]